MDIQSLLHPNNPGFWILISLLGWVAIRLTSRFWSPSQLRWINLARWILIPYAGLISGSLSPRLMGLTGIDWQATLSIGIVLTAILIGLMAVVRFTLAASGEIDSLGTEANRLNSSETSGRTTGLPSYALSVFMAGAEQFQWSFLRGAVWEIALLTAAGTDLTSYWAIWIATLLALPAVLLQPLSRADKLLKVAILVISTILFIFTRNFWLCWIFHASAWLLLASGRSQPEKAVGT